MPITIQRKSLTTALALSLVWMGAATLSADTKAALPAAKAEKKKEKKGSAFPALDILPEGSILRRVHLPRYNKDFDPISLLKADTLTVISDHEIQGTGITIEIYGENAARVAHTKIHTAIYDTENSTLNATEAIYLKGEKYEASGKGLIFEWKSRRGFLTGPALTNFTITTPPEPKKPSNPMKTSALSPAKSMALLSSLMVTLSTAAPPEGLSQAQLDELDRAFASHPEKLRAEAQQITTQIAADDKHNTQANISMHGFLTSIGQKTLIGAQAPQPPRALEPVKKPAPKPADKKAKPEQNVRVECDGGLYFDSTEGIFAYLKNVRLTQEKFTLYCRDELKVFLSPKEEKEAPKNNKPKANNEPEPKAEAPNKAKDDKAKKEEKKDPLPAFGEFKRVLAKGQVRLTSTDEKGRKFIATAETASYDAQTGEVILRGGMPRIQYGPKSYLQAKEPGLWIRMLKNGKLRTKSGKWDSHFSTAE